MNKAGKTEKENAADALQQILRKLKKVCNYARDYSENSQKVFSDLLAIKDKANVFMNKNKSLEYDKESLAEFVKEVYESLDGIIEVLDFLTYDTRELLKLSINICYDLLSIKKNLEEAKKDGEEVDSEDNIDELYYDNE